MVMNAALPVPALLLLLATGAAGQTIGDLRACRSIDDIAARVACYDGLVDGSAGNPATTATATEDLFGLPRPPAPSQTEERREMTVASARKSALGRWSLTMENGQRWVQTDSARLGAVGPGMAATISAGALGNFLMTIDGRTIRVRRAD